MLDLKEEDIGIIERDFDVINQDGEDRIAYEYYLKISNTPFFEKSEAEQLKQQILQDHEDAKKLQGFLDKFDLTSIEELEEHFRDYNVTQNKLISTHTMIEIKKLDESEKDRQIVKRLKERKEKANQANHIQKGDMMTISKFDADEFKLYNELQKILEKET